MPKKPDEIVRLLIHSNIVAGYGSYVKLTSECSYCGKLNLWESGTLLDTRTSETDLDIVCAAKLNGIGMNSNYYLPFFGI